MGLSVGIKTAVSKLNNQVTFLQPVYEAISNSLEAHSKNIYVTFHTDTSQINLSTEMSKQAKINGFEIVDDGDGFNKKNRDSFGELWTTAKQNLGCKGVGRLTWLKVFKTIHITSKIKDSKIEFTFSENFDDKDIDIKPNINTSSNETTITFSNVTDAF